ncbi:MAG: hypothetical protein E7485_05775 [Ruminococcaceae bacterium]|nr:hypothetical protein [Oscillospiraceae bacterium]
MLQLRKKILAGVLCSAMVLSASQSVAWSETIESSVEAETDSSSETTESADGAATEEDAQGTQQVAPVTEEQALAECQLYAESSTHALYVNESTGVFAVKDKNTGYCWWSNPYNADSDPVARGTNLAGLKSALCIEGRKVLDTEHSKTDLKSYAESVEKGGFKIEKIENGFKGTLEFATAGLTIPYCVTLVDDYFEISVPVNEIVERELLGDTAETIRSIIIMSLFKDLGAGSSEEEGYIITPDGSGAVINFNNGKTNASEYTQRIYGRDVAISSDLAPAKTEQAYLPIIGIVKEDNALLAVVTEGEAYATARASISGQGATGYNSAWFDFNMRSYDSYYMGQSNAALNAYEEQMIPEEKISVRYYPIAKEGADYVDVAHRYQKHLIDEGVLTDGKTKDGDVPFYLDLFGGTIKQQSVLGFPVSLETPATTYEEAKEIVEKLNALGIDNMVITYEDFNAAGMTSRISSFVDYSGTLGGKNAFWKLADYCNSIGATLAGSVDIQEFERSGNGYSTTSSSVIRVTKAYATQNEYERAFGTPHDTRESWYILTPAYYEEVVQKVVDSYVKEGLTSISLEQATNMLYSDFTANTVKHASRQQAVKNLEACFSMIDASGLTFVADACNDYALKYVDYIRNVPLYSSNFDVYDYDIPFYEIVIHGYIPYTTKAKNASSGADEMFLLSVATGTPVHYEVMHENPNEFTDCAYDTLFYAYYEGWLDIAANEYRLTQDHLKALADETITDFEYVTQDNVKTTFSDGTVIEADLENLTLKINGTEVKLADYGLKGATTD